MVLVQLLLPSTKAGNAVYDGHFVSTRNELVERFGGVTAYQRSPALGAWTDDAGHVERDEVIMVEVVTEEFDRTWWRSYRERLEARFSQNEVHIRALPIEMP